MVTYTGTGSAQTIAHDLGATVGWLLIKRTDSTGSWFNYHNGLSKAGNPQALILNETGAAFTANSSLWNLTYPTATHFTVGDNNSVNASGGTYVAYLFAHNDGDGEFGPDGDADIIKCGSGTTDGSGNVKIELGFEPQWIMWKNTAQYGWSIADVMRGGLALTGDINDLEANTAGAERGFDQFYVPDATGFTVTNGVGANVNFIYIAIRRGTKVPESATEVFEPFQGQSSGGFVAGFPVDMFIAGYQPGGESAYPLIAPRLTAGSFLTTSSTAAESSGNAAENWDNMTFVGNTGNESDKIAWLWKRAPGFFDVVCYEWNGTATRNVEHNLGVPPEMYIVKRRNSSSLGWYVRHKDFFGTNGSIVLNTTAATAQTGIFTTGGTTDTTFPVANDSTVNASGGTYIAYLFATLDGISKVGSYTGNGSSQTINCGFTSGARFILVKRTDSTGDWYVWDTERGIVTGNDPYLELNTTDAEVTSTDWVDPDNSGFIVNGTTINASSAEYIFYAIA